MKIFFIIMAFLALAACTQKTAQPKIDLKAEEQAIQSLSMKWLEAAKNHDVIGMSSLFIEDVVIYRENQEPVVGLAAIKDQFTKDYQQNPKLVQNWVTERVDVSTSGDLAVEYGSWNDTGSGPDGTGSDRGRFVTVYRKINDVWKVSTDCSLSTLPEEPKN